MMTMCDTETMLPLLYDQFYDGKCKNMLFTCVFVILLIAVFSNQKGFSNFGFNALTVTYMDIGQLLTLNNVISFGGC